MRCISAPRDDTARASCGNGAKANSYHFRPMFRTLKSNSPFSAPRDDTARASCGNGAKANSYHLSQRFLTLRYALISRGLRSRARSFGNGRRARVEPLRHSLPPTHSSFPPPMNLPTTRRTFLYTGASAASLALFDWNRLFAAEGVPQSVAELWADFDPCNRMGTE
jgi:hypothetical protein